MSTSEKYISEVSMKDKPKIPIGLFLRDKSVTTRKLDDEAVTEEKLAEDAVTTNKIKNNNVTTLKIADKNITTEKIADQNVTTEKIADNNVTTEKIRDNAIVTDKIKDHNVTWDKLTPEAQKVIEQAIDEVHKKSNYNDGDNIIDFNTIHLITDNPEFVCVAVDANDKILYGIKTDGQPYFGVGCPQQVKDYINEQINKILGTDDITTTIDSLKEIEAFLKDFTNSDTLKKLLDLKANVDEVRATTDDIYKKSNPNDSEGNVIDTNTIFSIKDNPEYIKALTDSVGKLIEAIGIDGIRKFFAGINIQGTLQCVTDNPEYIAVWLDNQERIVFGFKINGDTYFGYGIPSQINSVIESLKSSTETRIDALQQSIDNNILALDYNSDTGELYALTGETSTINASMDDNGDVYLEQEII